MIKTKQISTTVDLYTKKLGDKYHLLVKQKNSLAKGPEDFVIKHYISDKKIDIPKYSYDKDSFVNNLLEYGNSNIKYLGKKSEIKSADEIHFQDGIRKKKINNKWNLWYCRGLIYDGEIKTPTEYLVDIFSKLKPKKGEFITERLNLPRRAEKDVRSILIEKMETYRNNINKVLHVYK